MGEGLLDETWRDAREGGSDDGSLSGRTGAEGRLGGNNAGSDVAGAGLARFTCITLGDDREMDAGVGAVEGADVGGVATGMDAWDGVAVCAREADDVNGFVCSMTGVTSGLSRGLLSSLAGFLSTEPPSMPAPLRAAIRSRIDMRAGVGPGDAGSEGMSDVVLLLTGRRRFRRANGIDFDASECSSIGASRQTD